MNRNETKLAQEKRSPQWFVESLGWIMDMIAVGGWYAVLLRVKTVNKEEGVTIEPLVIFEVKLLKL